MVEIKMGIHMIALSSTDFEVTLELI